MEKSLILKDSNECGSQHIGRMWLETKDKKFMFILIANFKRSKLS